MSSYNLLKAAADGLAEAIRYRTNLKRQRRENEYNYNRDLGRKRDELDYMTDYNWKQQQRAHDRDIEWANQKREADKARILDFVDTYNPANVNRNDWADVQNFNTNAIANDIPLSIKYENLENLNKSLQDEMAVLKQKHDYKMAEIAANRMGRGGSSQPKDNRTTLQKNADWLSKLPPEEIKRYQELGLIKSPAVKGGSGNGAIKENIGIGRDQLNRIYALYKDLNAQKDKLAELQSSGKLYGGNDYDSMIAQIESGSDDDETKAQKIAKINTLKAADTRSRTNSVQSYRKQITEMEKELDRLIKEATGGTKGYSPEKDKGLFYDIIDSKNNVINNSFIDEEMLKDEALMNAKRNKISAPSSINTPTTPISVASAPIELYNENPSINSSIKALPEQIPSNIAPLPIKDSIATPALDLQQIVNSSQAPYSIKPMPDFGLPQKETNMQILGRALDKLGIPIGALYSGGFPLALNMYNLYDARKKGLINDEEYNVLRDSLYRTSGGKQ